MKPQLFFTLDPTGVGEELQFAFILRIQNSAFIDIGFSNSFRLLFKLEFKFSCDQFPGIFSRQVFCNRNYEYFLIFRSSMQVILIKIDTEENKIYQIMMDIQI
jgi:hypothetical protein